MLLTALFSPFAQAWIPKNERLEPPGRGPIPVNEKGHFGPIFAPVSHRADNYREARFLRPVQSGRESGAEAVGTLARG